jgi:uncharacterized protein YdeI (YjbR/CyaY-like superfamily)
MKPLFFKDPTELHKWFRKNHRTERELWVGLYKKASGKPSVTWPDVVDEALCWGWIDGVRKGIDAESYMNRVTPRTVRSNWSLKNITRVNELIQEGRMQPPGRAAFEARSGDRSGVYSYEQRKTAKLSPAHETQFRANKKAWDYFQAQPPSYRKAAAWWVVSAKRQETRLKRLGKLIEDSAKGRWVPPLTSPAKRRS